jgi:hypothetical protein
LSLLPAVVILVAVSRRDKPAPDCRLSVSSADGGEGIGKITFQKKLINFNYFRFHVKKMTFGMMLIINLNGLMRYALRLIDDLLTMHNT